MNAKERVEAVLRGRMPDRVPVCLHNFLPAAHEAGIPLEQYLTNPRATADAHLQAIEKYGHDCILIDLDTTMLAEAMGAKRNFTPGAPGHVEAPAITWRRRWATKCPSVRMPINAPFRWPDCCGARRISWWT